MNLFKNAEILNRYLEEHSSSEDPLLQELSRYTYLNEVHPQMLAGPILGRFLELFSSLVSPSRILEIGTFTGYSAICLARGLSREGKLTTIEANDELRAVTIDFFRKAGLEDKIDLINGDALSILPELDEEFDLVFMDANKDDYPEYYRLVVDKIRPGGYILADNVLWNGKVLEKKPSDNTTQIIREFNLMVTADNRVINLLLPLRDGLMIIKKL